MNANPSANKPIWIDVTDWTTLLESGNGMVAFLDSHVIPTPEPIPTNPIVARDISIDLTHPTGNQFANQIFSLIVISLRELQHQGIPDGATVLMKMQVEMFGWDVKLKCRLYVEE